MPTLYKTHFMLRELLILALILILIFGHVHRESIGVNLTLKIVCVCVLLVTGQSTGGAGHVGSSWAGLSTATTSAVATTVSDTAATWRGLPLLFGMGSIELSSLGVAALRCFSAAPYQVAFQLL